MKKHHWHVFRHEKLFKKQSLPHCQTRSLDNNCMQGGGFSRYVILIGQELAKWRAKVVLLLCDRYTSFVTHLLSPPWGFFPSCKWTFPCDNMYPCFNEKAGLAIKYHLPSCLLTSHRLSGNTILSGTTCMCRYSLVITWRGSSSKKIIISESNHFFSCR